MDFPFLTEIIECPILLGFQICLKLFDLAFTYRLRNKSTHLKEWTFPYWFESFSVLLSSGFESVWSFLILQIHIVRAMSRLTRKSGLSLADGNHSIPSGFKSIWSFLILQIHIVRAMSRLTWKNALSLLDWKHSILYSPQVLNLSEVFWSCRYILFLDFADNSLV